MLLSRAVDGDAYAQMRHILLDKVLHLRRMVVDAIGRKRETITVKPVVAKSEHLRLQIIADTVNQLDFQKRLTADKVPHHARFGEVGFMTQNVVNRHLRRFPRHALLLVLPHQVAVLASQLAVLRHNKRDILRNSRLPLFCDTFKRSFHFFRELLQVVVQLFEQ